MGILDWFRPKYREFTLSWHQMAQAADRLGVPHYDLWDEVYYSVSYEDWRKVLGATRVNMPAYQPNRFDCDKFAKITAARVILNTKLNTCGIAIGYAGEEYHAWNVIVTDSALYYYEPQTGELWPADSSPVYKADYYLF